MIFHQQVVRRGRTRTRRRRRRRKRNKNPMMNLKIFYLKRKVDRQDLKRKRNGNTWAKARRANPEVLIVEVSNLIKCGSFFNSLEILYLKFLIL
jgi:hypothetical protein